MPKHKTELDNLREYLTNPGTENAKDHLVFPLFQKLFGAKFKKQSDASGADIYIEGKLLVELKSDSDDYLQGFLSGSPLCKIRSYILCRLCHCRKVSRGVTGNGV
jgi:hypothetical protein